MPVRRRVNRRRADLIETWDAALLFGFDCLHALSTAGIAVDDDLTFDIEQAREAWRECGSDLLAKWERERHPDATMVPWAVVVFGVPARYQ